VNDPTAKIAMRNVDDGAVVLSIGGEQIRLSDDAGRLFLRMLMVKPLDTGEMYGWLRNTPMPEDPDPQKCRECEERLTRTNGIPLADNIGFQAECRRCSSQPIRRMKPTPGRKFVYPDVCDICGRPETAQHAGKVRRLAVDHDHVTGALRGVLCGRCNTGLGMFRDDTALIEAAAEYIENPPGILSVAI